ncbi:MAG TPA: chemotaxis protein CheW [bacterium]|nr:chemotaxis protein CheW [bacterium]
MPADSTPTLLGLEDLLPAELAERLRTLSPGIAWALESFVVSFGAEVSQLDADAREAFARLTLGYGENLDQFMQLAHEGLDPQQAQERARKVALLRRLDLFGPLNAFDLGRIASAFQPVTFAQGEVLAEQGQEGEAVYFLERGRMGIVVDGNQVAIRGEGALFGETSVVTGEPVNATLKAVTRCEALRISREDFVQHVLGLPELVPRIARIGFLRLEEATQRLSEVLGHMPDALLKIDREGIITGDISSKCFTYLGQEVLTGKRFSAVLFKDHPELQAAWDDAFPLLWEQPERYQQEDFAIPREVDFALPGDGLRHYEVNVVPCFRRGAQEGFDVAISDVTERKRVEEERARMQRALQRRRRKFILFRLGGQRFGLEIERVREIIVRPTVTRLPNAPAFLRGFFNLRGHIVPALDLYELLRLDKPVADERGCIFIVELERDGKTLAVGLLTDDVDEILDVDEANITPAAELALHLSRLDFLYGIALSDDGERLLLDVDRLISHEQHDALAVLQSQEA